MLGAGTVPAAPALTPLCPPQVRCGGGGPPRQHLPARRGSTRRRLPLLLAPRQHPLPASAHRHRRCVRWATGGRSGGARHAPPSPAPAGDEAETRGTLTLRTYKSHQWLGASVTSWDGKVVVGAGGGRVGTHGW